MSWWQSSLLRTAASAATVYPIYFLELALSSGTLRLHDNVGTINWGGNDWLGMGKFGMLGPLVDDIEKPWTNVKGELTHDDAAIMASVLTEDYYARAVRLYISLLNASGQLIDTPEQKLDYRFEAVDLRLGDDENPESSISAEFGPNVEQDFAPPRYTDEEQQRRFSSDRGFKWLHLVTKIVSTWGTANQIKSSGPPGGGGPTNRIPVRLP